MMMLMRLFVAVEPHRNVFRGRTRHLNVPPGRKIGDARRTHSDVFRYRRKRFFRGRPGGPASPPLNGLFVRPRHSDLMNGFAGSHRAGVEPVEERHIIDASFMHTSIESPEKPVV